MFTRKPLKEILTIGVPAFFETLFTTFSNIIDSKMVSAMGMTAISAVSVTNPPRLFIISGFIFTANIIFCGVNILFNYLLIEGHMGFPALGIAGATSCLFIGAITLWRYAGKPEAFDESVPAA